MTAPLASIIVVARDEERNLKRCLEGVRAQRADFGYELIVVDSGSRDRTVEVARSFGARVIEIPRRSFQHGATRQMASELARGDYLVYLVADAVPADERWLSTLVAAAAEDERVAGAYSRQVPAAGAGPIEAHRLTHRRSSGLVREVRELGDRDFWALSAALRFGFCEFDDVSCCRARRALEAFPIPAAPWAEDLLWARQVLLAGWRVVYEPASVVRHSHADTVRHAFRRGYLDQDVVKRGFGVLYFDGGAAALRGAPRMYLDQARAILASTPERGERARLLGWNGLRLAAEIAGNFLASRDPRAEGMVHDLIAVFGSRLKAGVTRRGRALRTRFELGDDSRPTLFMHPNAFASARLLIPSGARLKFGAAIGPAARPLRKDPVLFVALVEGEPVWSGWVGPGEPGRPPRWIEASVDLSAFAGRRVELGLATWAADTDHAWAGWGAPRIAVDRLSTRDRLVNRALATVRQRAMGGPLRHP